MCCKMLLRHNWVGEARALGGEQRLSVDALSLIQRHFFFF